MSEPEVSKVGVIDTNANAKKEDEKLSIQSYKILTTTIATSLAFTNTFISSVTNTTGLKFLADSGAVSVQASFFALAANAIFRGISAEYQHTERMYLHQVFRHRILENFFHTNMFQTEYKERNVTIVKSPIKSFYSPYQDIIEQLNPKNLIENIFQKIAPYKNYEFFPFKFDQDNLKRQDEVNVAIGSQFTYTRPQQFEFSYVRGADNDELNYGIAALTITKKKYEKLSSLGSDLFPAIPPNTLVKVLPDPDGTGRLKAYSSLNIENEEQKFSVHGQLFKAAWMDKLTGPHYWVKFPVEHELDEMLGKEQANLIKISGEYQAHLPFFKMLNAGGLADIMNHPIPDESKTMFNAIPLSQIPKDLAYNMKHHGILKVDFARGQRQQYNVITATGKVFVVGATHTYYTHNRKVINFLEYGEKHDVYKFFVHSTANYHFACKSPYPQPYVAGAVRPIGASVVNYRYEGNFNIEQVTAEPWAYSEADGSNTSTGGRLINYIQGIHGETINDYARLSLRSPFLEFNSAERAAYTSGGSLALNSAQSQIYLFPNVIHLGIYGEGIKQPSNSSIFLDESKITIRGARVLIASNTQAFTVQGNAQFNGDVEVHDDCKFKAQNIIINHIITENGNGTLSGSFSFI